MYNDLQGRYVSMYAFFLKMNLSYFLCNFMGNKNNLFRTPLDLTQKSGIEVVKVNFEYLTSDLGNRLGIFWVFWW